MKGVGCDLRKAYIGRRINLPMGGLIKARLKTFRLALYTPPGKSSKIEILRRLVSFLPGWVVESIISSNSESSNIDCPEVHRCATVNPPILMYYCKSSNSEDGREKD